MKQTFWMYQFSDGCVGKYNHQLTNDEIRDIVGAGIVNLIGTIDLDVQPVKKEVERERFSDDINWHYYKEHKVASTFLPTNAYDVKVVYKVKE